MQTLNERITQGWKDAMKCGDTHRRDVLSGLRAALKKAEIDARTGAELSETDFQAIIDKEGKKRRESIEEFSKAGRDDLAQKERAELEIIQEFLPQQLSDDELLALVREAVAEVGAESPKDMGRVMTALMPKIAGRADGKAASAIVKDLLK